MASPNIQIRAVPDDPAVIGLKQRAVDETGPTLRGVVLRDLARYYHAVREATPRFTEAEASLIVDACNGTLFDEFSADLIWAEVDDAIRHNRLADKWAVDGSALVERLRQLSSFERLALVDAAERVWLRVGQGESDMSALLREVGLTTGRES